MTHRTMSTLGSVLLSSLLAVAWSAPVLAQQAEAPAEAPQPARSGPPEGLEEIIVTSEKREALLLDTPVAVSAFNTEKMIDLNLNHGTDYTTLVPGVSYRVSPNRLFIRGVGRTDNSLGLDPGVAMYTDGIYTSETAWLFASHFGMQRVEIMRGPQGTLYGRNATGGTANVIRQRPQDEFHAQGRVLLASDNERQYGLILTGPISERVRYHLLMNDGYADGTIDNLIHRDNGDSDNRFYEAMIEVDLTDRLKFFAKWNKALWDYVPQGDTVLTPPNRNSLTTDSLSFNTTFDCTPNCVAPFDANRLVNPSFGGDAHQTNVNSAGNIRLQNTYHVMTELTYDADSFQVKYLYGFQTYDWNLFHADLGGWSRIDGNARNIFGVPARSLLTPQGGLVSGANDQQLFVREDKQYYSHEVQITSTTDARLQWLAGLFYYNEEIEQPFTVYKPNQRNLQNTCGTIAQCFSGLPLQVTPNATHSTGRAQTGVVYHQIGKLKSAAWAAFGEVYYDLAQDLKLTFGLRYSRDRKHGWEEQRIMLDSMLYGHDYENGLSWLPAIGVPAPFWFPGIVPMTEDCCAWEFSQQTRRLTENWDAWSGRVVLSWSPSDDALVYGSITEGYKAGGFRLGSLNQLEPIFDKEDLLSYEIGYKQTLLDKRLMFDAAVFYYDYQDQQVLRSFRVPGTGITHAQVINADDSESYGFELAVQALATQNLLLFGNYSYLHSEFEDFCCSLDEAFPERGNQDLKGNDLPQSPKHKYMLGATYTWYTGFGDVSLTGRYSFVDDQTYSIFNTLYADDYHRTDLTLQWVHPDDRYRVIAYVKNLEDDDNYSSLSFGNASSRDPVTGIQSITGFANPKREFGIELLFYY